MKPIALFVATATLAGCASKSAEITPTYVSPVMYQTHTCKQLAQEAEGVSARAAQVSGAQDAKRSNDQVATGVAIIVFWPGRVSCWRRRANGCRTRPTQRPDGRDRASVNPKEVRHSIPTGAARARLTITVVRVGAIRKRRLELLLGYR
jgi:hypothetical protein